MADAGAVGGWRSRLRGSGERLRRAAYYQLQREGLSVVDEL
jgi:hypothetical protein